MGKRKARDLHQQIELALQPYVKNKWHRWFMANDINLHYQEHQNLRRAILEVTQGKLPENVLKQLTNLLGDLNYVHENY